MRTLKRLLIVDVYKTVSFFTLSFLLFLLTERSFSLAVLQNGLNKVHASEKLVLKTVTLASFLERERERERERESVCVLCVCVWCARARGVVCPWVKEPYTVTIHNYNVTYSVTIPVCK